MTVKELQDFLFYCDPKAKIEIFDIDLTYGTNLSADDIEYSKSENRVTIYI